MASPENAGYFSPAMERFHGERLTCVRGGRTVFAGLSFAAAPGGALVLLGPNGSGKSSLLRMMAGLLPPAAGGIFVGDAGIGDDPEAHRARVGYVGHLDGIKAALTTAENLALWSGLRGGSNGVARGLEAFGLGALADMPARLLSAGQRRRLALARLIAAPAPLWLLDEPTVALDREAVAALEAAVARHRTAGGIAVVSTNVDLGIADPIALQLNDFAPAGAGWMDGG